MAQGAGSSAAVNASPTDTQQSQTNKCRCPNAQDPAVTPNEGIPTANEELPPVLSPDDPVHFCLLSKALKFWIRRSITTNDIEEGQSCMEQYLRELPEASYCMHCLVDVTLTKCDI